MKSRMGGVVTSVLTVNASYGANLSAHQLAAMIADSESASECNASVFAFFSEVSVPLQKQFIKDMGVDEAKASMVAAIVSELSGYTLPRAV